MEDGKSGFDSRSVQTKPKRKEPIKVDINITVVPKNKKVSASSCTKSMTYKTQIIVDIFKKGQLINSEPKGLNACLYPKNMANQK